MTITQTADALEPSQHRTRSHVLRDSQVIFLENLGTRQVMEELGFYTGNQNTHVAG